ncbi:MAG: tetratricopeptide repeat protein [Syntrophales bacterium LBB04]|nr:tetratricopeptide repeat protein [Syntrophales bacterium LBB04]
MCTKAIDSSKLSGADLSAAYKNRGKSWEGKKEYDQAIADYNKSLEIDPNDAGTYFARGSAWFDKAEYDHYLEDYNKAMDLSHNDPRSNPTL